MQDKEYRCKWCNVEVAKYATVCSECSKKWRLVKEFRRVCDEIKEIIKPKPDIAEVVRCKRCVHANDDGTVCRCGVGKSVKPNDFCSKEERKC